MTYNTEPPMRAEGERRSVFLVGAGDHKRVMRLQQFVSERAPRTAGQAATALIRERIMSGDLAPGATLNQNDLAAALNMSRIPIRDALHTLAGEGLVLLRAHATATVTPLSIDDLQELYDIRLAIEPRLSREAMPFITNRAIERMRETLSSLDVAEAAEFLELNHRFHHTLYSAADKPRSSAIVDQIRAATDRYLRIYHQLDRERVQREHHEILAAVEEGQGQRLEGLVSAHLSSGYETMLRYLAQHPDEAS